MLLFYLHAQIKSEIKIFTLSNITVNTTKVVCIWLATQSSHKKLIWLLPDFCPVVEFDSVKFGTKVHVYSYSRKQDGLRLQEMGLDLSP